MVAQPQQFPSGDSVVIRMNATVQDLLNLPDDDYGYEMIEGVIVRMPPPQEDHGEIITLVNAVLIPYCFSHGMRGKLLAEVGYQLWGNKTVLAPDLSVIQSRRASSDTYSTIAPLLAIEIASPSQSHPFFQDKAKAFITAGTQMVWVLWQDTKTIDVYTAGGVVSLGLSDIIDGDSVLPGFTCPVVDLFP
jgi:Uma2 family endonuclease